MGRVGAIARGAVIDWNCHRFSLPPPATLSQERKSMTIPINDRTARNRENASHSTGPKTEAGKKRSCLNALRHGLTGHTIVLPAEDHVAYQDLTNQFFDDFKPVGILEKHLVQALADTSWRLQRR